MRIIVIRPEPGCTQTVAAGALAGITITPHPMFDVQAVDWTGTDPAGIDGILLGSANAIRHGGPQLARYRHLPVYAVGASTARFAQDQGFVIARTGAGGLQQLIDSLPRKPLKLLRLSGKEHILLSIPAHITLEEQVVYDNIPLPMADDMARQLSEPALVLLHSANAAQHFASECDRQEIRRNHIAIASLGSRIGDAAGKGWKACFVAKQPQDKALLALAAEICDR
ncbi:MAG: uroporphyrinogen-III synthase [Sphingomonadaceae bacterium]